MLRQEISKLDESFEDNLKTLLTKLYFDKNENEMFNKYILRVLNKAKINQSLIDKIVKLLKIPSI